MELWAAPSHGQIPPLGLLAGGLVLVGLLGGSVNGVSGRAVMLWFADGERGLAMSIRQTAVPKGGGIGALLLPAVALQHGFAAIYSLLAVLCLLGALLTWGGPAAQPPAYLRAFSGLSAALFAALALFCALAEGEQLLASPLVWLLASGCTLLALPLLSGSQIRHPENL